MAGAAGQGWALTLALGLLGCAEVHGGGDPVGDDDDQAGDDDHAGDDDQAGDDDSVGPVEICDRYTTWGYFHLTVDDSSPAETWIGGMVEDGPEPWILDELQREGDCTLYGWEHPPFCEPACDADEYCGFGDVCREMPLVLSVGTVDVTGTTPPVTLEAIDNGVYIGGQDFANLYQPGDVVTLSASGGDRIGPFELSTPGVEPLGVYCDAVDLSQNDALTCTWMPSAVSGSRFRLVVTKSDQHGALPAELICDVGDSVGSLTVPASLIDAIWDMDVFDQLNPVSASVQRYTAAVTETELGCVELRSQTQSGPVELTFSEATASTGPGTPPRSTGSPATW